MKKANIILSAIGLVSVVGGALAFKAQHRFSGTLLCYTTVGRVVNNNRIFAAAPTKYLPNQAGTTLYCTIPLQNNTYQPLKVIAAGS